LRSEPAVTPGLAVALFTVEVDLANLTAVAAVAVAAPLALGLLPALRLPAVVLELVAGIALGPAGLGWIDLDAAVDVLALLGLAFLLFLAGLEIDLERLRGRPVRLALAAFGLSLGLALLVGEGLAATGLAEAPVLLAIALATTSLGVVVPVLKDADEAESPFGQLVIAAASIADFGAILLLSLLFSREATGTGTKLAVLGGFALLLGAVLIVVLGLERWMRLSALLVRLQDTTAQIRVRGAFLLLVALAALAQSLGLEVILGAFAAGVVLGLVDRDEMQTHAAFRTKLDAVGFGVFVPVFFVASGLRFDLDALFASASTVALVPLFLAALVVVRGVPAVLYRPLLDGRRLVAAGLLQATSLPFIVAATAIGQELGLLEADTAAALIAAGLLSLLLFPLAALLVLRERVDLAGLPAAER
jgi:Kef-type K+ transport system membrane component KefB